MAIFASASSYAISSAAAFAVADDNRDERIELAYTKASAAHVLIDSRRR